MKKNYALSIILSSALLALSGCGSSSSEKEATLNNNTKIEVVNDAGITINAVVSKVNAPPVATFKTFATNSGVIYNGMLTAEDRDLDNIEFKLSAQPKHGRVTVNANGTFVYTPEDGYVGKDNFSYIASDDISSCPIQIVEVEVAQKPITIPNAPTNLKLEAISTCKVKITWDDNSDNELGFDIYRDGELVSVEKANDTTTNICGDMQPATTYHIEVKAKNEAGSSESVSGDVTTKDITTPPKAPTNLEAKAVEENCVRLTWEDNAWSESAYEIYQDGKLVRTVSSDCSCVVIKDLSADSSYNFTVKAVNKIGKTDSNTITVDTEGVPVITLVGGDESLVLGDTFTDKGATAKDKEDGDLNVTVSGSVDTKKEGDYTITYNVVDKDGNKATASRAISVAKVSVEDRAFIPIDSNLELGPKGFVYYVDPRPEENGHNRALKINYLDMSFQDVNVTGINPHSLDRAGDSDRFYIRTQNSKSFDVISFEQGKVLKTVDLVDHKPRAIGATNLKYNLQLLSARDMAVVDVIDTTKDEVIATLGERTLATTTTGHSTWLDSDHFVLIDRANKKVVVYKVVDKGGSFDFVKTDEKVFKSSFHTIERVTKPLTKDDLVTFYSTGEGDVSKGIPPYVNELKFDPTTGTITSTREVSLDKSTAKVVGVSPITHHAGTTPDGKYFIVPVFDGNVYIIDRKSFKVVKTIKAALGAAHIEFSQKYDIAIITNHFSNELTFLDMKTLKVTKRLTLSKTQYFDPDPAHADHRHLLQPHFSYIGLNGDYFYTFATQDGDFLKINLETLEIEDTLHVGGAPEQAHS
jgi:hypothetical protein